MKDLTKGFPAKVILRFAIPLMLGSILQQLYNMTDSKIVSVYIDTDALAAIGATSVISNMIIYFLGGITQGFSILIAKFYGAKDNDSIRRYIAGTFSLTIIFVLILTTGSQVFIRSILRALNTPADIFDKCVEYVVIILWGTGFCALYNMSANVLRAMGDSLRPLIALFVSVVCNIFLDILFVKVLGIGIKGAALATIISQALSGALCFVYMIVKLKTYMPKGKDWKLDGFVYKELFTSGIAMGLMNCIVGIGSVILQTAINGLGTMIVTAHIATRRVFDLVNLIIFTISSSMTTYVSQNYGAQKFDRIRSGVHQVILIETGVSSLINLVILFFAKYILQWVASTTEAAIIDPGVMYLLTAGIFSYALGPLCALRCSLQGMEYRIIPIFSSIMEMVLKAVFAFWLIPILGYFGVAITEPVCWVIMFIILIIGYSVAIKKLDKFPDSKSKTQDLAKEGV